MQYFLAKIVFVHVVSMNNDENTLCNTNSLKVWLMELSCRNSVSISKVLTAVLLFVLQLRASSSRPAVSQGQQEEPNCVSSARETAPGPRKSLTTVTVELSS